MNNSLARMAKDDETILEHLIRENEAYLLSLTSKVMNRHISKQDDEWSVTLLAFYEAINQYSSDKGSFQPFVELVIRRRLLDHFRRLYRIGNEITVDPDVFTQNSMSDENAMVQSPDFILKTSTTDQNDAEIEIESIQDALDHYGFTFYDLIACSPKSEKTKQACKKAINCILSDENLIDGMRSKAQIPIKEITEKIKVPRKLLERHRRYIIAAVEILLEDYPILTEYLRYIKEDS